MAALAVGTTLFKLTADERHAHVGGVGNGRLIRVLAAIAMKNVVATVDR
jgi:hypothetical protein